jgi:hypothetical protein
VSQARDEPGAESRGDSADGAGRGFVFTLWRFRCCFRFRHWIRILPYQRQDFGLDRACDARFFFVDENIDLASDSELGEIDARLD